MRLQNLYNTIPTFTTFRERIFDNTVEKEENAVNPFPNDNISDWSKLKEYADNNFRLDENGREFSKQVGNTVGKGEIACYEQFLLFPQCFQKTCNADTKNQGLFGKGLTSIFFFYHNVSYSLQNKLQLFSHINFVVCKINAFNLDYSYILSFGKDLSRSVKFFSVNCIQRNCSKKHLVNRDKLIHYVILQNLHPIIRIICMETKTIMMIKHFTK